MEWREIVFLQEIYWINVDGGHDCGADGGSFPECCKEGLECSRVGGL